MNQIKYCSLLLRIECLHHELRIMRVTSILTYLFLFCFQKYFSLDLKLWISRLFVVIHSNKIRFENFFQVL